MKKQNLVLGVLLVGMSAHAAEQSQTLLRLEAGSNVLTIPALTTDFNLTPNSTIQTLVKDAGLLYDHGPGAAIKSIGGNYALTSDSILRVSETGSLFTTKATFSASALGGNFFVSKDTSELIAIDSSGCYLSTGHIVPKDRLIGGNFYIDMTKDKTTGKPVGTLVTIKHMGVAACNSVGIVTVKTGMGDYSSATKAGGNFFIKDKELIGIASETGFYTNPQKIDSQPKQIGGNYFIGEDKVLYTINNLGFVMKQSPIIGKIKTFGYSYLLADDGYLIYVDGKGIPHTEMVKVFPNGSGQRIEQIKDVAKQDESFIQQKQN